MTDNTQELREILEKEGWKYYDELNGFRKESQFTIPMFSTDQSKSYDSLSAGNYHELKDAIQAYTNAEIARTLDRLESTAVYAEYDKAEDDVICGDVVPLDAIQAERANLKEVK